MSGSDIVVDASVVLAFLQREPFTRFDPARTVGAWISSVNLCEVLAKLCLKGLLQDDAEAAVRLVGLRPIDFSDQHARIAARLVKQTRRMGLSLGDCACLATGLTLGVPVVTADRAWASLGMADVIVVR